MANLVIPEPNEKQKLFLSAKNKYIAYGGARGGGKSWSVRTKSILLCLKHPGIKILIMRRTYPELQANHIDILRKELVPSGIATYNITEKKMTFKNGSIIKFMYCKNDADLDNIQGHEYDCIFIDEATNMTEKQLRAISVCCRGTNSFPKHVYFTMNPGGPGHGFIKRLFIDRRFNPKEKPEEYTFIQALVDDNKALMESMPDYVDQLEALPTKLREAWRFGKWDVFEGQVFGEFTNDPEHYIDRQRTHVIEPFDIPRDWNIYRGFDWGYSKPFSCHWYALDPQGIMYCFREFYGCTGEADVGVEWTVERVAREIAEIERTDPMLKNRNIIGVADPAIFAENGGESIAETMSKHRVYFKKGDHARIPGKMQCHYRLAFDEEGYPMFYVFNTCKHFIRTIPSLMYSETQVEDIDTHLEDHIYDEWRYVCMARPLPPRRKHTEKPIDLDNVFDPIGQIRDQQKAKHNRYDFMQYI